MLTMPEIILLEDFMTLTRAGWEKYDDDDDDYDADDDEDNFDIKRCNFPCTSVASRWSWRGPGFCLAYSLTGWSFLTKSLSIGLSFLSTTNKIINSFVGRMIIFIQTIVGRVIIIIKMLVFDHSQMDDHCYQY